MRRFVIFTHHQRLSEDEMGGDMCHVLGRREMHTEFWWGELCEVWRVILKCIFKKNRMGPRELD
jgi:hypothetical protein